MRFVAICTTSYTRRIGISRGIQREPRVRGAKAGEAEGALCVIVCFGVRVYIYCARGYVPMSGPVRLLLSVRLPLSSVLLVMRIAPINKKSPYERARISLLEEARVRWRQNCHSCSFARIDDSIFGCEFSASWAFALLVRPNRPRPSRRSNAAVAFSHSLALRFRLSGGAIR